MQVPGRFLSFLTAVGSTGGILKTAYRYFLGETVSKLFKVGVGGISGSTLVASGSKTGCCLGGSARRAHSVGRLVAMCRCAADSARGTSAGVSRGSSGGFRVSSGSTSLCKICHLGCSVVLKPNHILFLCSVSWGGVIVEWRIGCFSH